LIETPYVTRALRNSHVSMHFLIYNDNMNNVFATCISVNRNKGALRDLRANAVTLFQREAPCCTSYVHEFLMHDTYIHATLLSIMYLSHWIIYYLMSKRYVDLTNQSYNKYTMLYYTKITSKVHWVKMCCCLGLYNDNVAQILPITCQNVPLSLHKIDAEQAIAIR